MSVIVDDNNAMTKLLKYVWKLVKSTNTRVTSNDITHTLPMDSEKSGNFKKEKLNLTL